MSVTESNTENHEAGVSQVYELSYLLLPSIPEESLSDVVAKIEKIIEQKGGQKIDSEAPFLRDLAYEMTKVVGASRYLVKTAYIGWIKFDLPISEDLEKHPVEEINALVDEMAEILRFLLVKAPRETKFTFASTQITEDTSESSEEDSTDEDDSDDDDSSDDEGGDMVDESDVVVE